MAWNFNVKFHNLIYIIYVHMAIKLTEFNYRKLSWNYQHHSRTRSTQPATATDRHSCKVSTASD